MYGTLALSHRALDDLAPYASQKALDEIRTLARPLEGLRVLHLSVTGFGTGTAELLNSSVPLFNDLGLDAYWQVVRASEDATAVSREMYRALGGASGTWTAEMTDTWHRYASMNAALLTEPFDVIVVHDPQPLAIHAFDETNASARWVAHSHLDYSAARADVWPLVRDQLDSYDAVILDAPGFGRDDIKARVSIIAPAIDPNSPRNMELPEDVVRNVLVQHGIDPDRPMICQISPCDAACDIVGVFDAWKLVRQRHPDVQLLMVLFTKPDDDESRACYDELVHRSLEESDVCVLTPGNEIGNIELNVFQTAASVVMQKGLRKGYGLWIADALWKRRPCVVAREPGLQQQVIDGETGIVASTTEEFADAVVRFIEDQGLARQYGENGRRHIAERFLITRYLGDYLKVLSALHRKSGA